MLTENIIMKERERIISWICYLSIIFFFLSGVVAVIRKDIYYIFDWFFGAALIGVGLFIHRKVKLNYIQVFLGLAALSMHHMKLYGKEFFGLQFDGLFHFFAVFAISLIIFRYIYRTQGEKKEALLRSAMLALFVSAGIASMLEIIEYFGYYFMGPGGGILFYGVGDIGEWANSSWDMTSNTLGAALGCLISYFWYRK